MSNVFFIGDTHFGHKGIQRFRGMSEEENRNLIKTNWNNKVTKRDTVYVMGDAVFKKEFLADIAELNGTKHLVRGNHDYLSTEEYLTVFKNVYGIIKYKNFWLSHCPIHPEELRGKGNIHGHVHYNTIQQHLFRSDFEYDTRYFNTSCEMLNYTPISFDEITNLGYEGYQAMATKCENKRIKLNISLEHCE